MQVLPMKIFIVLLIYFGFNLIVQGISQPREDGRCEEDEFDSNCSKIYLTYEPIQIHSPQMKFIVEKGARISLPCRVLNLGGSSVFWKQRSRINRSRSGGRMLIPASLLGLPSTSQRFHILSDHSLEIFPVSENDEGFYECFVDSWPRRTIIHHVRVLYPASIRLDPNLGSITVTEKETIGFSCFATGNPISSVEWVKPETFSAIRRSGVGESSLNFTSVSPGDAGTYICRADNGVGSPTFGQIQLNVLYSPVVEIPQRIVYGDTGGPKFRTHLECHVTGNPKPQVEWIYDGKVIPPNISNSVPDRIHAKNQGILNSLHFNTIIPSDFGIYTCRGNNSLGYGLGFIELSGVPECPILLEWKTSVCTWKKNGGGERKRHDGNSMKKTKCRTRGGKWKRRHETWNVTSKCYVDITLFWAAKSYSPLIDFHLMFRRIPRNRFPMSHVNFSHFTTSTTRGNEILASWTEIVIPADSVTTNSFETFPQTKLYKIEQLRKGADFQGALRARNKHGRSHLSTIFNFTAESDVSHKLNDIWEVFPVNTSFAIGGGQMDKGEELNGIYEDGRGVGHGNDSHNYFKLRPKQAPSSSTKPCSSLFILWKIITNPTMLQQSLQILLLLFPLIIIFFLFNI